MQLAFSNDNGMLTSLATARAVSQGKAHMLKFCPCFVCISSVKMGKWCRIFKSTVYSLRAFKGLCWAANADFRILNQRLFVFISQSDVMEQNNEKEKWIFAVLFSLSSFLYFCFLFVRRLKKVEIFLPLLSAEWFPIQLAYLLQKHFPWFFFFFSF